MSKINDRLRAFGLVLPPQMQSAPGMAELPGDIPVEIEGEVELFA